MYDSIKSGTIQTHSFLEILRIMPIIQETLLEIVLMGSSQAKQSLITTPKIALVTCDIWIWYVLFHSFLQWFILKINWTWKSCLKTITHFCTVLESYIMRRIAFEKKIVLSQVKAENNTGLWGFTTFTIEINEQTCNCNWKEINIWNLF